MQSHSDLLTDRSAQSLQRVSILLMAACLMFIAGTLLIDGRFVRPPVAWIFPAATAVLGLLTLQSYVNFLRVADELLRKIHIEALALGFGAGAVFMLVYRLCERLGAPKLDSNDPLWIMAVFCGIGLCIGIRRYSGAVEE